MKNIKRVINKEYHKDIKINKVKKNCTNNKCNENNIFSSIDADFVEDACFHIESNELSGFLGKRDRQMVRVNMQNNLPKTVSENEVYKLNENEHQSSIYRLENSRKTINHKDLEGFFTIMDNEDNGCGNLRCKEGDLATVKNLDGSTSNKIITMEEENKVAKSADIYRSSYKKSSIRDPKTGRFVKQCKNMYTSKEKLETINRVDELAKKNRENVQIAIEYYHNKDNYNTLVDFIVRKIFKYPLRSFMAIVDQYYREIRIDKVKAYDEYVDDIVSRISNIIKARNEFQKFIE